MYLLMLFSAFILQTSATAPAGEVVRTASATNADAPAREEAEDANKKICKSFKVTGSRAKRERICMTRTEWIDYERGTRNAAGEMTNQEGVCSNAGFCGGGN